MYYFLERYGLVINAIACTISGLWLLMNNGSMTTLNSYMKGIFLGSLLVVGSKILIATYLAQKRNNKSINE